MSIEIFTDGGCSPNPGPGGFGAIIVRDGNIIRISQGYAHTTNNRMELIGAIKALELIDNNSNIVLTSDSKYLVDAFNKNWIEGWVKKGWKGVKNIDLWKQLLFLTSKQNITWKWIKGHSGHPYNEKCDELATQARSQGLLIEDKGYV